MPILDLLRSWQTYKNVGRIREIVNVFLRHGFGQLIEQLNLQRFIPLRKKLKVFGCWHPIEKHTIPERLRMAFSELGPSFIKLAQLLSSRPDLITKAFADEFKKLQDEVPPFPVEEAKEIIEAELHISIKDMFSYFEDPPIAAASIAQVHKAALKTGEKVVVKVQRPDIREIIETDIAILNIIARLMVKYIPESKVFNPLGIVDEFSKTVRKELNFVEEAKNAQRFKKNFAESPHIHIPIIYPDLTSERVIVMERLEGVRIDDIEGVELLGVDSHEIAKMGVEAYFKMMFEDGFFHADPHPGNIFVMPDGRLGLMDFGIVGWLTPELTENIANVLLALVDKDFDRLIDQYIELGIVTEEGVDIEVFKKELKADLIEFYEPLYGLAIAEINFAEYLDAITHLSIKHGLRLPSALLLMNKTLLILDNIGRQLDPAFNFMTVAEPYAAKLVRRQMGPGRIYERAKKNISDVSDFLATTPKQIGKLLRKTLRDELSIKINPIGMDRLIRDIDRSSNRLAFSIIVAAIIMGSSLLIQSGIGGKIFGLPAVGAIGFFIAFILGLWLLVSIIKSGRL
ncbi:MAG: AarF/ABC1/UbiB kinase family protein [Nitrospirae bacterium]|nr:AarF/ABC1/UbiB kinase family protein [Nitrospirota bacterium]